MSQPDVVVVVLDTLRRDHVGAYGAEWIDTTAIDDFAADPNTVRFTEAYPEAMPTMPIREGLMTGMRTLPYHFWEPLDDDHATLAELLRREGYITSIVSDNPHMAKPRMNYQRGFDAFQWIRGQENDKYRTAPEAVDTDPYLKPSMRGTLHERILEQYLRNTADRGEDESEYFAARVFAEASDWVRRNPDHDPVFLWVDSFDPHEPWDPPPAYRGRYTDQDYDGPELINPKYGVANWVTTPEVEHIQGRYAEEVEFVDDCLGRFLDTLRAEGRYEDSLIVVMSDHGVSLGDHNSLGKPPWGLYGEVVELPLFLKLPTSMQGTEEVKGEIDGLVQTHDLPVTLLDLLGLGAETSSMDGQSTVPLLTGEQEAIRDVVVTGFHPHRTRCVRDGTWSYLRHPEDRTDELYHVEDDRQERHNQIESDTAVARRLLTHIGQQFEPSQTGPFVKDFPTVMARHGGERRPEPDDDVHERLEKLGYF